MNGSEAFRQLLRQTLAALAVTAVLFAACYAWVDRPVAWFVHEHEIDHVVLFKWLTYPPPIVEAWSPLVLALLVARRAWGPLRPWQRVLLVSLVALVVGHAFRTSIGSVCGRYWPETWFHVDPALAERPGGPVLVADAYLNNPSLIGNDQYGFHPFRLPGADGSFPSGHATRILALATVWWLAVPRSRWLWILICPPLVLSLAAMNYHFVGDLLAGSVLAQSWASAPCG